jgi:hypothetical protein
MTREHPPGPPMTLGNMRELGVRNLIAYCHNDACRHQALVDVSAYADDVEVPSFQRRAKCGKCGGKCVDVRPNWKETPRMPDNWQGRRVGEISQH